MKYDIFEIKERVVHFIFVTVIYKLLCILYKLFLYYPNELIYRCCVFIYVDSKERYDKLIQAEHTTDQETRLQGHATITFLEAVIVFLVFVILHG